MPQEQESPEFREGVRARMIDMWAKRFLVKRQQVGHEEAVEWATGFFNPKDAKLIAQRANQIINGQ